MGRSASCSCSKQEEDLNRGAWTASEDRTLSEYIKSHGVGRWRSLAKKAGLKRCGNSCRLRWMNYLRPDIKRGNMSPEEEDLLIRLHRLLGNRWALIAGRLPGRTDSEIKNYWNTHLSKKVNLSDFEPKFHNPFKRKRKEVPSYSNCDEQGVVDKDIYTTAVRYCGREVADLEILDSYNYDNVPNTHDSIIEEEGLKATDDHVVEIDTSKSWRQLLLENCMGDSQYDQYEAINGLQQNSIISTSIGTDDHPKSTSPSHRRSIIAKEDISLPYCNLLDQEFPQSMDFRSSVFDDFLDLGEPSFLLQ